MSAVEGSGVDDGVHNGARASWSLAARLTAWYAGTAFLLVAGAGWVQYRALDGDLAGEDDRLVIETLAAARRGLGPGVMIPAVVMTQDAVLGPMVRQLDADCRVVRGGWPPSSPPAECPPTRSLRSGKTPDTQAAGTLTGMAALRTWRSPAGHSGGSPQGRPMPRADALRSRSTAGRTSGSSPTTERS